MKLTEHFTLEELTYSATAAKQGIDNTPTDAQKWHLFLLASFLEELRVAWGSGIDVTSAFRGFQLKGSSSTSAHPEGWAADLVPSNRKIKEFKVFVRNYLRSHRCAFDQYIDEKRADGAEWVHIGLYNLKLQQRRQYLITTDGVHYSTLNF